MTYHVSICKCGKHTDLHIGDNIFELVHNSIIAAFLNPGASVSLYNEDGDEIFYCYMYREDTNMICCVFCLDSLDEYITQWAKIQVTTFDHIGCIRDVILL